MDQTQNTIKAFNFFAKQYQDKFMDFDLYHDTFDFFCEQIKKGGASVLEVGCGPGNITRYLLQKRPDLKIIGIDLSEKMIALARENNPTASFEVMDARDISALNIPFDAIMCGFCFPYLSKEEVLQFILDASALLRTNGLLYISTMEDDYNKSGYKPSSTGETEPLFIHYHQADYLAAALEENGFAVVKEQRKNYPESDGSTTIDLIMVAQMK